MNNSKKEIKARKQRNRSDYRKRKKKSEGKYLRLGKEQLAEV